MIRIISAVLVLSTAAQAGDYYGERNLAELQKRYARATPEVIPWAGYWWPYNGNGIAEDEFATDRVSPAQRLDAHFGWSNWIAGWERANHGAGRGADWWGHCNGWATAAIMEREPREPKVIDGTRFEVADQKALLTEYWLESGSDFIGTRVYNPGDFSSQAFWDVVPAQFHLVMTNVIGRQRKAVIVDRYTGHEVWNQPVVAYEIHAITKQDDLGRDPRYTNVWRVNVSADFWWATDEIEPQLITPPFDWKENDFFTKRTLKYELWLDGPPEFDSSGALVKSGDIILTDRGYGGQWKNGTTRDALLDSHPDFIWVPISYARSSGYKNPRINDAWIHQKLSTP